MHQPTPSRRTVLLCILLAYSALMVYLLFGRTQSDTNIFQWEDLRQRMNLIPFHTLKNFLHALRYGGLVQKRLAVVNLAGNVLMFIPFGYLIPALFRKFRPFLPFLALCFGAICLVEILQLISLRGILDVDDVLLNIPGVVLGYGIYRWLAKRRPC